MLTQPTVEKLYALRLNGMADAFRAQQQDPNVGQLGFEERLTLEVAETLKGGRGVQPQVTRRTS